MSINLTRQNIFAETDVYQEESEEFGASSFAGFVWTIFLGLVTLLVISAGTYLAFSGIVTALLALLT